MPHSRPRGLRPASGSVATRSRGFPQAAPAAFGFRGSSSPRLRPSGATGRKTAPRAALQRVAARTKRRAIPDAGAPVDEHTAHHDSRPLQSRFASGDHDPHRRRRATPARRVRPAATPRGAIRERRPLRPKRRQSRTAAVEMGGSCGMFPDLRSLSTAPIAAEAISVRLNAKSQVRIVNVTPTSP